MDTETFVLELNEHLSHLHALARRMNELDFAVSLTGEFRGMQDAGWATTITAREVFTELLEISQRREPLTRAHYRHFLMLYCQLAEAGGVYESLKNVMGVVTGTPYLLWPFKDLVRVRKGPDRVIGPNANATFRDLARTALDIGMPRLCTLLENAFRDDVRNAVSHADYVIWDDGLRLPKRNGGYAAKLSFAEISAAATRALAFFEQLGDYSGEVAGTGGKFLIDRSLLPSIQFLREGEFDEKKGAPALKLIGEVEPVSEVERERTKIIRDNVTPDAVVRNFLRNERVAEPMQYIHYQAHAQRKWFPVWFYIDQTQSTAIEVAEDLRKQVATYPSSRDALVDRLAGKETAFRQSTGTPEALRAKLARGDIEAPTNVDQDVVFAGAIQALTPTVKQDDLEKMRATLIGCLDRAQSTDPRSSNRRGAIYRAACRLDELLYLKKG